MFKPTQVAQPEVVPNARPASGMGCGYKKCSIFSLFHSADHVQMPD
jgi:hypothetical protein